MKPKPQNPGPPPFFGYFPPSVDGTLLSLINASTPGHPERESRSAGALAEERFMALETLEVKMNEGHEAASRIVQAAAAEGKPFGLYLRNFRMGAKAMPGRTSPYGDPHILTVAGNDDLFMQKLIHQQAQDRLPFVSIANRAWDAGPIPHFVFSDESWRQAAEILIQHASAIVMFFLTLTPGVAQEFELLRKAGAEDRTLILVADNDPRQNDMDRTLRLLFGSPEVAEKTRQEGSDSGPAPERRTPPPDFTQVAQFSTQAEEQQPAAEALDALLRRVKPTAVRPMPALPPEDRPSEEALQLARNASLNEYDLGFQLFEKGDGVAAEDALIRSIAFSHWSRDPLGRAVGLTLLGHIERHLLKYPNEAVDAYFMAVNILESLLPTSEVAVTYYEPLVKGLAAYLKELGDLKRAEWVLQRFSTPGSAPSAQ